MRFCSENEFTPTAQVTAGSIAARAAGYGMPGLAVDGNDAVEVYRAVRQAVRRARDGEGPTLLECGTYRLRGHSTGDPARYRSPEEVASWQQKDPLARLEEGILAAGLATAGELAEERAGIEPEADAAREAALRAPLPGPERLFEDVYAPDVSLPVAPRQSTEERSYREAIRDALREEMERDARVVAFGEERVRDAPISESTLVGMALGAGMTGLRPVCEIMFVDLMALTMDQMVNLGAKIRYMTGGQAAVPVVVRAPSGITGAAAATHSQSLEAWFYRIPGLKVVMPATPADAKGLLKSAIRDDNLVIFLEVKSLSNTRGPVPSGEHLVALGKAEVKRPGTDVTLVATGAMVLTALEAADQLAREGISVEVVDPRSLVPLDLETILASLRKTGRLLLVEEAVTRGSVGADIAAEVAGQALDALDAPVVRLGAPPVPIPFSPVLESLVKPSLHQIESAVRSFRIGSDPKES